MEKKRTYLQQPNILDKITSNEELCTTEPTEFLPRMPQKIRDLFSQQESSRIRKKFSDFQVLHPGSEINIFNKFLKNDSNILFSIPRSVEERKGPGFHLPSLSKKEPESSTNPYQSPNLSPCFTKKDLECNKKSEASSPFLKEENPETSIEYFQQKKQKRGSSATRGFKSRGLKAKANQLTNKLREANLDTLLMYRNNTDLAFLMQEYNRRQGLSESTKIFILTGQHDFIRRALKKRNWTENKITNSLAYNLKWCYNDSDYDYKNLRPGQYYNHFPNNRELTTKSGLAKNLRNLTDFRISIDSFFPRCYDLGDSFQVKELINDYRRTGILNVIKKVHLGYYVEDQILKLVIAYAENVISEHYSKCEKERPQSFNMKNEEFAKIMELEIKQKGEINAELLVKINELYKSLGEIFQQFYMEGCDNIWIIKPGQNARGSGVRCVRGLQEILDSGTKMQSRVVQKYTECPLLLPLAPGLCKFDLRIWVLTTSFDPLTVYIYNTCYCRLCQEAYSLDSLDAFKHLANYSIQKSISKNQSETVWSLGQLVSFLESINVSWEEILKQMHYIIIQTLKTVTDVIETKPRCFELYGFDIILDSNYKPWLLEVNLSPACAERSDFLTQTLDSMGEGLLKIVLDGEYGEPIYDSSLKLVGEVKGNTQEWVYLYKGESISEEYSYPNLNLEIIGEKFNIKREKNIERKFLMARATLVLQKQARKFLVKIREEKNKVTSNVLMIQKIVRRKLAYLEYHRRIQIKMTIKIQSFWRMKLGQKVIKKLKDIRKIELMQSVMLSFLSQQKFTHLKIQRSCLFIQTIYRQYTAKSLTASKRHYLSCVIYIQKFYKLRFLLLNTKALMIQKHFRGLLGRRKFNKELRFINSILSIQKQLRQFFSFKHIQNLRIEKSQSTIGKFIKFSTSIKSLSHYIYFRSAIVIQKYWLRHSAKKLLMKKKQEKIMFIQNLSYVQKILKGFKERKRFKFIKEKKAAVFIQKNFRGYRCRKYFMILRKVYRAAVMIQKHFRGYVCRKKYYVMRKIYRDEMMKKSNLMKKKKEMEKRAIKASERLFKGNAIPEIPTTIVSRITERPYTDYKNDKIGKMKSIYLNEEDEYPVPSKCERSSIIQNLMEELRPKRDRSKPKKTKKRAGVSVTQYGQIKY